MELKLCHLYPDVLNLYGDRGNILCMERRLRWRRISVETTGISVGEALRAQDYDLLFVGGGQDFDQETLLEDLRGTKTTEICAAIEDGMPVLAICGGYQMLGQYYRTWDGVQCDFVGALDLYTVGGKNRMIGDYMFSWDEMPGETIVGFENHSGKTYLGRSVQPLGSVITGFGNNGEDGTEGVRYKNVYGTYSHGCLLPKNPVLCDRILLTALQRKYPDAELPPLDSSLELTLHEYMVERLK